MTIIQQNTSKFVLSLQRIISKNKKSIEVLLFFGRRYYICRTMILDVQFDPVKQMPTFGQLVTIYGPWLGLIVALIIVILLLQYYWFRKLLSSKNEEIKRLVEMESELNKRVMTMIDQEIGYKKKKP